MTQIPNSNKEKENSLAPIASGMAGSWCSNVWSGPGISSSPSLSASLVASFLGGLLSCWVLAAPDVRFTSFKTFCSFLAAHWTDLHQSQSMSAVWITWGQAVSEGVADTFQPKSSWPASEPRCGAAVQVPALPCVLPQGFSQS